MRARAAALVVALGAWQAGAHAQGSTSLMSSEWARTACAAWNAEPTLTDKLAESGWAGNDAGRGFKVIQLYRADCVDSPRIELRIASQAGKARCIYGGGGETAKLNFAVDYLMYADTARWQEMGRGEYGPMRAMMFSRLQFDGPMLEAMSNMGPFEAFLLLVGKVPGGTACAVR